MSATLCDEVLSFISEEITLDKTNSVTWKLRIDPADANSGQYDMQMQVLDGGEPLREVIVWRANAQKVFNRVLDNTWSNRPETSHVHLSCIVDDLLILSIGQRSSLNRGSTCKLLDFYSMFNLGHLS